ncbi:hypothetical protein [Paenibacillus sp. Z6-24]
MEPNLQVESELLDNCRYLLDIDNNCIAVNEQVSLGHDNPVRDQLTFQLLNPERDHRLVFDNPLMLTSEIILKKLQDRETISDTSYIRFFFPCGDEQGDFIDVQRGQLITFETESGDWSVAHGVVEDGYLSFVISCYNRYVIETLFSVYFRCLNIQSYTPIGLTYVYADIQNVVGIQNVIKTFPIRKTPATPQINRFFSDPTTIGAEGTVRLEWQTSGAGEGQLTPGRTDIFSLSSSGMKVELNRNMAYHLSIKGNGLDTEAFVNLYVHPPEITQLDYDPSTRQAAWQSRYNNPLQLGIGTAWTSVDQSGKQQIVVPDKPQLVLRAKGRIYREAAGLNLQGLLLDKPQRFESRIRVYADYVHSRWNWITQDSQNVLFQITEDNVFWYTASRDASGTFKYVSELPLLGARLICTKSDGSPYPVLLLNGEVAQWTV